MKNQLQFHDITIQALNHNNQIWITSSDLATLLQYSRSDKVTQIYNRNKDEFSPEMSENFKMRLSGNLQKTVRIFSLRGAHLIAMLADTRVAKGVRKWLLDLADKELREKSVKVNNQIDITIQDNRLPKGVFVHQSKYNPYRAYVWDGGKSVYVGCYPTVEDAQEAQRLFLDNGIVKRLQKENRVNQFTNSEEVEQYLTEINLANQRVQSQLNALSDGLRTLLGSVNLPDMAKDIQLVDYISGVAKRRLNR